MSCATRGLLGGLRSFTRPFLLEAARADGLCCAIHDDISEFDLQLGFSGQPARVLGINHFSIDRGTSRRYNYAARYKVRVESRGEQISRRGSGGIETGYHAYRNESSRQ